MTALVAVASALMLVAAGFPLAYFLARRVLIGIVLAPLIAAATTSAATAAMLAVGGYLLWWAVPLFVAQWVAVALLRKRASTPLPLTEPRELLWLIVPLLPMWTLVADVPDNWDARSMWWLHSGYYARGAEASHAVMTNPHYAFSHPDYPPFVKSAVGTVWSIFPGNNLNAAQLVSATISFSVIVLLVYAVRRITAPAGVTVSRLCAVGVGLAVWYQAYGLVLTGYMDALWSSAFVGAFALLVLGGRDPLVRPGLPVFLLTIAALAKNEALATVVLFAALLTIKEWRAWRRVAWVWLPVAIGGSWVLLVRSIGVRSDLFRPETVQKHLDSGPSVLAERAKQIAVSMVDLSGPAWAIALTVALVGLLFLRGRRRELGLSSDLWLWAMFALYGATLFATYLFSPYDLAFHLRSSLDRVTVVMILLGCLSAVSWAVVAFSPVVPAGPASADGAAAPTGPAALNTPGADDDRPAGSRRDIATTTT